MRTLLRVTAPVAALAAVLALIPTAATPARAEPAAAAEQPTKVTMEQWKAVVDKAVAYLKSTQEPAGGWSTKQNPGVTGVVVTGVLLCGVSADDPPAAKGLEYIESLINPQAGHIAGQDPK